MGKVYLNNFPRTNAVKGQEFKGDKALEDELTIRGVIGDGEVLVSSPPDTSELENKVAELQTQVDTLKAEKIELENKVAELQTQVESGKQETQDEIASLHAFVEKAVGLAKGTYPNGYKKD